MKTDSLVPLLTMIVSGALAVPVLDLDFTETGFSDGAAINGIEDMSAQGSWDAEDTAGIGYATSSGAYQRARNYANFTLETNHSVVIETTLRLNDADGVFNSADNFKIGFAENAVHSGANTPSVGSTIHTFSDGSYWLGATAASQHITVSSADAGDWIKFTQIITRSDIPDTFTGMVSASNVTDGVNLGSISSAWTESTADGSWGGTMRPSFRVWENAEATALEIDRWTVFTITNEAPPVVTNPPPEVADSTVHILIDPEVSVAVDGHLQLDRSQFINLSDAGKKMDSKVANSAEVDYYINDLGMNFGRELGGAYGVTGWNKPAVKEDPARSGFVDMSNLEAKLNPDNGGTSQWIINHFSPNLGVATHDRYGSVPDFMPTWYDPNDDSNHTFAVNGDAYAEYVTGVLEHGYTDWTRPATYEIINEPSWRVWGDQRFADLHTAVQSNVVAAGLDVAVGGPCMSVGYFYKDNYQKFNLKSFIDNTGCDLDFYSFHVYDYMHWDAAANDFNGRVSTGLPIEGVLDLVQSYTHNAYGKGVEMVLSEHGGYISTDQEGALDTVANTYFPGSGFEWEMKRRSVNEFLAVSSEIANTMAFMNNPHVVRKAVPFILLESASWNPEYYSTLLVKENFNKNSSVWHESKYVNFFRYFQKVSGRRVRILMDDPDIQCQAYAEGGKLFILLNNLATRAELLQLNLPTIGIQNITLRRFGRNPDFTPYFTETQPTSLNGLQIEGREALAIELDYTEALEEKRLLDEVPYYADLYQQQFTGSKTFAIHVPDYQQAKSAMLRIGVGRSPGTDQDLTVTFNGTPLHVPMEDCADYLENSSEYGSTKLVQVPADLLQLNNAVVVSFPGNGSGGVGAVVLRAALERSGTAPVYSQWVLDEGIASSNAVRNLDLDGDGFDSFAEFICGTGPQDGDSYPTVQGIFDAGNSGFRISIDSRSNRLYAVEATDNLLTGWADLTNRVPGNGGPLDIFDDVNTSNRFYRIRVEIE